MPVTTADTGIRDQLKRIRDQLADLRSRLVDARREQDAAKQTLGDANFGENVKLTDTPEFRAAEQAVKKVGDLKDEIAALQQSEVALLRLLGEQSDQNGTGHAATAGGIPGRVTGWNGHRLLAGSEPYAEAKQLGLFASTNKFGTIQVGQIASREDALGFLRSRAMAAELPAAPAGTIGSEEIGSAIRPDYRGVVPPSLMSLSLLDLIPSGTTDSNLIEFGQVVAVPDISDDLPEEGAIKPQAGLRLADASAPVRTIPGWIKVKRQTLEDLAGLGSMINTLLPWAVRRRLLTQILIGDGQGQNITGLYTTTGVGEAVAQSGDNLADVVLRAITVCVLSDGEPNFCALNPVTWTDLLLMKNSNGNYIYGNPGALPGGIVAQTIWGLALTTSRAVPADKPLVGDSMGCQLLVREAVNVKISDSDQDDFVRNLVTILAEMRVAFPVWRPSSFAIADLSGVTAGGGPGGGNGGGGNGGGGNGE